MNDFTDTHFHLQTMAEKGIDPDTLDISYGMDIGCQPEDIYDRRPLIARFPGIVYSVAAGPWCTSRNESPKELVEILRKSISDTSPACIGEIGLDYYHKDYGPKEEQKELFIRQIELANELGLPIAVHTRDAEEDTIDIIRKHPLRRRSIMHCFSGSEALARTALEEGFFISFSGTVTYKSNTQLQKICTDIPEDRLLLETDSPYLSPVPYRGRMNTPMQISATYGYVSNLRKMETDELKQLVKKNFDTFLGLQ